MTISECIKELKPIAKHYKVRVFYSKTLDWAGGLSGKNDNCFTISLLTLQTSEEVISCFFHELGHTHCKRNKIWESYHSSKDISKIRRTGLKAEMWIDKWAAKEMKKWFPNIKFIGSYSSLTKYQAKKWYHTHYLNKYYKSEKQNTKSDYLL